MWPFKKKKQKKLKEFTPGQNSFFQWIYNCTKLLESKADIKMDGAALISDMSWFACYDEKMTPEQAVDEYIEKNLKNTSENVI